MDIHTGWRWLPLAGVALMVALVAWRIVLQRRRYGGTGLVLFRGDWRSRASDAGGVLVLLVLSAQAFVAGAWPDRLTLLVRPMPQVGWALMFGGLVLMFAAQLDMARSWRIGIDESARPGLVTTRLYASTRNPIYTFVLLAFAGYALSLPTWISAALLVVTAFGIRQQVLREEAYLARAYGDEFTRYARRVGRFVPWLGRKRD